MSEAVKVDVVPCEPDWRFSLSVRDRVVAELFFDADRGWESSDRPLGWVVRYLELGVPPEQAREEPVRPDGAYLNWGSSRRASDEAAQMVAATLA
ncbi:MAG: hypothetical protein NVSMB51_19820 [Solirubrobacteraceae bacterium]